MRNEEWEVKLQRVHDFMQESGFDGVLFASSDNFTWLTCGGYAKVDKGVSSSVVKLFVTKQMQYVICNSSEQFRIPQEELGDLPFTLVSYKWHENEADVLKKLFGDMRVAADVPVSGCEDCSGDLQKLRYCLTNEEIDRYREVGALIAEVTEDVCSKIKPGQSEYEVAGELNKRLISLGCELPVCMVASDERIFKFRHPVATDKIIKNSAMVAICAQKYGLVISISRIVYFSAVPAEIEAKLDAVAQIDATYITSTRPDVATKDIIEAGYQKYKELGYEGDFHLHHQGGAIGYQTRDYCANFQSEMRVHNLQAFSWNPTIAGVKSEDTFLVIDGKQEIISQTATWPLKTVSINGETVKRPDILRLG